MFLQKTERPLTISFRIPRWISEFDRDWQSSKRFSDRLQVFQMQFTDIEPWWKLDKDCRNFSTLTHRFDRRDILFKNWSERIFIFPVVPTHRAVDLNDEAEPVRCLRCPFFVVSFRLNRIECRVDLNCWKMPSIGS